MEKKQRPPKRKFKEIYAEQKERIHNKEKLPKEKKKRVACGVFAVLYIIISLFLLLGKCNFVNANSESYSSSFGYASVPYEAMLFRTGTTENQVYKQFDTPMTNLRTGNDFYTSLDRPITGNIQNITWYEYIFPQGGVSFPSEMENKLTDNINGIDAYLTDAFLFFSESEDGDIFEGAFNYINIDIYSSENGGVDIWGVTANNNFELIWNSITGLQSAEFERMLIRVSDDDELKKTGEGWEYLDYICTITKYKEETAINGGEPCDIEWLTYWVEPITSGTIVTHDLILNEKTMLYNENMIRFHSIARDFAWSNKMFENGKMIPKFMITGGKIGTIIMQIEVSFDYVIKTPLDNGTYKTEIIQDTASLQYTFNEFENTAYNVYMPLFPDLREFVNDLPTPLSKAPEYYYIRRADWSFSISNIEEMPTLRLQQPYGWSANNGTYAEIRNLLLEDIGNIHFDDTTQPDIPQNGFLSWLGTALDGFFNTDIVGVFSLGDVLWIGVGFGLFFAILKMFAGG